MSTNRTLGHCFLFDVGQGTANAVLLQDGRGFVFDPGPRRTGIVTEFFAERRVRSIECVILSHNDRDHIGGWEQLAKQFGRQIKRVIILQDRDFTKDDVFDVTISLVKRRLLPNLERAEVVSLDLPKTLWEDERAGLRLELWYPDCEANVLAIKAGDANATSAICAFYAGDRCVVFPGDSTVRCWRRLVEKGGKDKINVDVVSMPHHGGLLDRSGFEGFSWLFGSVLNTRYAVFSVGTGNSYGHPRKEYVEYLAGNGTRVLCTQLGEHCGNARGRIQGHRGGVMAPFSPSLSDPRWPSCAGVGCAGTVVCRIEADNIVVERDEEHRSAVASNINGAMCMKTDTSSLCF